MEMQIPGHKTMCWALPKRDHAALGWEQRWQQNPKGFFGGGEGFSPTPQLDLVPPAHPIPVSPKECSLLQAGSFGKNKILRHLCSHRPSSVSLLPVVCPHSRWGGTGPCPPACHQGVGCPASSPVLLWIRGLIPPGSSLSLGATLCHSTGCPLCSLALSLWANAGHSPPEPALGGPWGPQCHSGEVSPQEVPPRGPGVSQCPPRRWPCTPCCPWAVSPVSPGCPVPAQPP